MTQIEDIIAKWLVTSGHQTGASADADARLEAPALLAAVDAAGLVVVPKEPNLAMQNAGWREVDKQGFSTEDTEVAPIYRAMIEARPK